MELERFYRIQIISPDGNTTYTTDSLSNGMGISQASMHLNEMLWDKELELGACNANKFEVQIYGLDRDVTGYWIIVDDIYLMRQNPSVRPTPWFKGIIDSAKTDKTNSHRDIVAYDYLYSIRDYDITDWFNNFWSTQTDPSIKLATLRNALCTYAGFQVVPNINLVNDGLLFNSSGIIGTVPIPTAENLTVGKALKAICELQGCVPNIDRRGYLDFVPIGTTVQADATDITNNIAKNNTVVEDYTTQQIGGIVVYNGSNIIGLAPLNLFWRDHNVYKIKDNLFLNAMTQGQIWIVLDPVATQLQNVTYSPATIYMLISDDTIKLGDLLRITDQRQLGQRIVNTYHIVCSQVYSGSMLVDQEIESTSMGEKLSSQGFLITDPTAS